MTKASTPHSSESLRVELWTHTSGKNAVMTSIPQRARSMSSGLARCGHPAQGLDDGWSGRLLSLHRNDGSRSRVAGISEHIAIDSRRERAGADGLAVDTALVPQPPADLLPKGWR